MAITPSTNLFLLKNPLEIDNKNQLTFTNKQTQYNYFHSLPFLEVENISYQRKDNIIRFPGHIDNLLEYNYCMYQNENYTNKWFYAFITNMRYVNDNMTEITITTDVWQTWQFDLTFKQSFIEREMINVNDDIPGANLLPEGLETGEFTIQNSVTSSDLTPLYGIAYLASEIVVEGTTYHYTGGSYNGILNGILFIIGDAETINDIIFDINVTQGLGENIMTVFTIPQFACPDALNNSITGKNYTVLAGDYTAPSTIEILEGLPTSLNGYTPKNQKLRTFPYVYLGFNPSNGSQKILRYEDFTTGQPSFKKICEINQNPTAVYIPQNYKNVEDNVSESVTLNGYPTISWKTDYFNSWLAQNNQIISLQMSEELYNYEIGQIQTGVNATGNIVNQAMKGNLGVLSTSINAGLDIAKNDVNHDYYIKNQMAQIEKQQMLPDKGTLGSSNSTLLGYNLMNKGLFTVYTIKKQFAERIDKFFDCFGYLTNQIKLPNLHNRPNWNYVKTIGVNIQSTIPQNDLQAIKNLFDNGITLWHNPSTFLDYSQNNR